MKILLVDDQNVVREALAAALEAQPDVESVVQAESAAEALDAVARGKFDVAVVELSLADRVGTELISQLKAAGGTRVLVLSTYRDELRVAEAMRAGADGYTSKRAHLRDLLDSIRQEYKENEDLPNTTNPDDWAKISGKKGERIVYIRTLISDREETTGGRSIERVGTGQYL